MIDIWQTLGSDETAEMMDAFAWYLGLFVGTLQLLMMPEGGIWLTGGVTLHYLSLFEHPAFMAGIEASPSYLALRKTYPLGILKNQEHAIIGGGYYAANRLIKAETVPARRDSSKGLNNEPGKKVQGHAQKRKSATNRGYA